MMYCITWIVKKLQIHILDIVNTVVSQWGSIITNKVTFHKVKCQQGPKYKFNVHHKDIENQKSMSRKRKNHARMKETNNSSNISVKSSELHDSSLVCDTHHKCSNKTWKHNELYNNDQSINSTNVVKPNNNLNKSAEHVYHNFFGLKNNPFIYNT